MWEGVAGCGYRRVYCAENYEELDDALKSAKEKDGLAFIEVKAAIGAREDLGRPSTTPVENKEAFMGHLFGGLAGKNKQN